MLLISILILSLLSYFVGARAVFRGEYKPNVYSRTIWFAMAVNGLVGLILLNNEKSVIVLSVAQTLGSLLILILSFKYSIFRIGTIEIIASVLLLVSGGVWLLTDLPLLNVSIGLVTHFIAGLPSLNGVLRNPKSEHTMFWGYFAIASCLSLIFSNSFSFQKVVFPVYFLVYNLLMVFLSLRKEKVIIESEGKK